MPVAGSKSATLMGMEIPRFLFQVYILYNITNRQVMQGGGCGKGDWRYILEVLYLKTTTLKDIRERHNLKEEFGMKK